MSKDTLLRDPAVALIEREAAVSARHYAPMPVVIERAHDVWLQDVNGRRYLDFMSAYSAVSHGHCHPRIVAAALAQMQRVCITSRAYHGDTLAPFLETLCRLTGFARALPMNTGAEAVETAIKAIRRWAYRVRGNAPDRAEILVAEDNFHGRTTTIVGFSSQPAYRADFGPFAPGFRHFRFGDLDSLAAARTEHSCAVVVEPIQGEAGIIVPPPGWLAAVRRFCDEHRLLLVLDEVQSGLGRSGRTFAFEHEGIRPDGLILGKALGGGVLPVSAFLADEAVMGVFEPGSHGSTFGGNALAAAVGLEALRVLRDEQLAERSAVLGRHLLERLHAFPPSWRLRLRGRGLWAGVDFTDSGLDARAVAARLAALGVLSKETHDTTLRIAPPLTISKRDLDWGIDRLYEAIAGQIAARAREARPLRASDAAHRADPAQTTASISARSTTMTGPLLLLSPPDHFEVTYRINPWMEPDAWAQQADQLAADARDSWRRLVDTYRALGARLVFKPAVKGLPDLVFTANSAVVLDGKVLLARFRNAERQGEQSHDQATFEQLRAQGLVRSLHHPPPGVFFEGAGDAIWDARRGVMWMGHGQRSSFEARDAVREVFGVQTLSLQLASPRFYHLDTCFCLLSGGEILWYAPAFSEDSAKLLRDVAGDALIDTGDEDALGLGVNAVCIGRDIVMCCCSAALRARLQALGYRVHVVPLAAFNRSGGAAYCLTLRLDAGSQAATEGLDSADQQREPAADEADRRHRHADPAHPAAGRPPHQPGAGRSRGAVAACLPGSRTAP